MDLRWIIQKFYQLCHHVHHTPLPQKSFKIDPGGTPLFFHEIRKPAYFHFHFFIRNFCNYPRKSNVEKSVKTHLMSLRFHLGFDYMDMNKYS